MTKNELLKAIADMLASNIGNKITNELASGIYAMINQNLTQLKPEEKDGELKDS